ncbi:MAG: PAS domain S-box protein [Pseudohongiellaceae bacterium]|nr:PAS domain S-box protein [Pseudohongiellaceae bacterium]
MSLRFRVNLAISLIGIIFVVVTAYILIDYKRRSINEEIDAGTRVTIQLLESIAANPAATIQGVEPLTALTRYLQSVGRVRANEVRLYNLENSLVYESPPSEYKKGRWAPDWFSRLVSPDTPQVRLDFSVGYIVITPDSSRSVLDAWDELRSFGVLILVFFVLLNFAVFRMLGRSLSPLQGILAAMSNMEKGSLTSRLPEYSSPEFNAIGHTFNRMAQSLEDALAQNARLALIAKQSSDAILIRDLDGTISFCNPSVERLFGFELEEVQGSNTNILVPAHCAARMAQVQERVVNKRTNEYLETQLKTKQGDMIEVAISIAPLIDPSDEELIGEIYAIRDMSEHKQRIAAEVELEQSRKLTQLIHEKLEEERKSIARELHDELGQCVTAIKTIGTAIANRDDDDHAQTKSNAESIVSIASHIYDVVHSIIKQLRPSALDHLGLADALTELVEKYKHQNPATEVTLSLGQSLNSFNEKINITVYRVVQECLTNVSKHAAASQVNVNIRLSAVDENTIEVEVSDNGKGVDSQHTQGERFGLLGIRERIEGFGGHLVIDSKPSEGTTVRASLPIDDNKTE